ncbi:MAG: hypothetical protein M0009_07055 [Deltaproteobacteria bacterium]|nr:hypothetical protein [Deltaproteobacteria bacterium]
MNEMEYCNQVMVRMEELLYQELSGCAAWKVELIGVDFIQSKNIQGKTAAEVVQNCIKEIEAGGLVKKMQYEIGGKGVKLVLKVQGCVHLPKERKLKEDGIKPYNCVIMNMVIDQLIEKLGYETSFIGDIHIDEAAGACTVTYAIFENADKIGCVSDWSKE